MSENFVKRNLCPACGSDSHRVVRSLQFSDDRVWPFLESYYEGRIPKESVESDSFSVASCNDCDLLFQEYILNNSNMALLYEEWISAEDSLDKKRYANMSLFKNYAFEIESICRLLNKSPHEIDVLEYGMGWGFWSILAKAYNFNVTGVEVSKSRAEFAQRSGLRVIQDVSRERSDSVDYVYSNQVFEHIPDPKDTLQQCARILRPGGVIQIEVPNGKGLEKELLSSNWRAKKDAIHPLEHINCFNRNSLKVLANQAGLTLRPVPYQPRPPGVMAALKGHFRYIHDSYFSTRLYLSKA